MKRIFFIGTNFTKMTVILFFSSCILSNSCKKTETFDHKLQVFDRDEVPFGGNYDIAGRPFIPLNLMDLGKYPYDIFTPGTATINLGVYPWEIYGEIKNGKIAIDFPNEKLELTSDFEYSLTEGVRICLVYIEHKDSPNLKFGLHKRNDSFSRVYIYYSTDDFNRTENGIALKAGWNFVEQLKNPKWVQGSHEPIYIVGLVSQDVNVFLKKGYRWKMESWI